MQDKEQGEMVRASEVWSQARLVDRSKGRGEVVRANEVEVGKVTRGSETLSDAGEVKRGCEM